MKRPKTDEEFNKILFCNISPEIARAFCDLECKVKNNSLSNELDDSLKECVKIKANQMKNYISDFIDSQVTRICSK